MLQRFFISMILSGGICIGSIRAEAILPEIGPPLQRIFQGAAPGSLDELRRMESYIQQLSQRVIEATVSLRIETAHGSGVIVGNEGYVLTAAHVIGQPNRPVQFTLSDGRVVYGKTLGVHMQLDAGLAQITDAGTWPHLKIGRSDDLKVGQWCMAAGHPGGVDVARGVVVRLGRILDLGDPGDDDSQLLRTDCQLNAGDSGGPLVNMQGLVIGINSRIGTSLTNNLHTPSASFRERWDEFVAGKVWRSPAYLGVTGDKSTHEPTVGRVREGSPAERAGIEVGDIVTRFAGHEVHTFRDLVYMVQSRHPGEEVTMQIERDGTKQLIEIVVGRRPE